MHFRPCRDKIADESAAPERDIFMKRGDIYMAVLDPVIGSEQGGYRPVVIIQNDLGNLHAPTVIVAPITSRASKPALPTHASIPSGEGGLRRSSTALCEQVRTLEKSRLKRHLGSLSAERLRCVDQALRASLDIGCKDGEC